MTSLTTCRLAAQESKVAFFKAPPRNNAKQVLVKASCPCVSLRFGSAMLSKRYEVLLQEEELTTSSQFKSHLALRYATNV